MIILTWVLLISLGHAQTPVSETPANFKPGGILSGIGGWFKGFYDWLDNWVKKLTGFGLSEILRAVANFFVWIFSWLLGVFKWLLSLIPNTNGRELIQ